ncbi:MAG: hypothetical protein Q9185_001959 [Variospora sp. 1 TL-2023]
MTLGSSATQFLHLPLEIRQLIYAHVLPYQTADPHSTEWACWEEDQCPIALLYTNRQIHDEVLEILCRDRCTTLAIEPKWFELKDTAVYRDDKPPLTPAKVMRMTKHWQLSIGDTLSPRDLQFWLLFEGPSGSAWTDIQQRTDKCAAALCQGSSNYTLKVKLPCLCCVDWFCFELIFLGLAQHMQLLKRVRVTERCTFIASQRGLNSQCKTLQCSQLAAAFAGFSRIIEGKTPTPNGRILITVEERWISLKNDASQLIGVINAEILDEYLALIEYGPRFTDLSTYQQRFETKAQIWLDDYECLLREEGKPPRWLDLELEPLLQQWQQDGAVALPWFLFKHPISPDLYVHSQQLSAAFCISAIRLTNRSASSQ